MRHESSQSSSWFTAKWSHAVENMLKHSSNNLQEDAVFSSDPPPLIGRNIDHQYCQVEVGLKGTLTMVVSWMEPKLLMKMFTLSSTGIPGFRERKEELVWVSLLSYSCFTVRWSYLCAYMSHKRQYAFCNPVNLYSYIVYLVITSIVLLIKICKTLCQHCKVIKSLLSPLYAEFFLRSAFCIN